MRKLVKDSKGLVVRFKANKVVLFLAVKAVTGVKCDMNDIWTAYGNKAFSRNDLREYYQLIGYSVSGFGDIFYKTKQDKALVNKADNMVIKMLNKRNR